MVSKVNVYLRTWPFAIDPNDRSRKCSIGVPIDPVNAPVVLDNLGECKLAAAQQKETQRKHGEMEKMRETTCLRAAACRYIMKDLFQVRESLKELPGGV